MRSFILTGWQFREKVALVLPSFFTFISSQCLCYRLKIGWQKGNSEFYPSDHKVYHLFTVLHFSCFIHTLVCRKRSIFSIIRFVSQVSLWYTSVVCIAMLVCEMVQCSNSHLSAYKGDQCFDVFKDNISGENVVLEMPNLTLCLYSATL